MQISSKNEECNIDKKQKIKSVIENASTVEEINRIELLLKSKEFNDNFFDKKFLEIKNKNF